jgi:hypothetical protein
MLATIHSVTMQLTISISPAIPSHFTYQFMVAWTEAGETQRVTHTHAPHSIWSILGMILSSQLLHGIGEEVDWQR